ncbi:DUF4157 domain-containing protein [Moorena producens]|uniref:eCIS core domain-containing protein n=1 Tax=Moorena producens TaxID=1155739 RepID=UPI003C7755C5
MRTHIYKPKYSNSTSRTIAQKKKDSRPIGSRRRLDAEDRDWNAEEAVGEWGSRMANVMHSLETGQYVPDTGWYEKGLQAKLTIGQPGDKYEQEADRVARQVVQQINTPQMGSKEEEVIGTPQLEIQRKPLTGGTDAPKNLEGSIKEARGRGKPLDDQIRRPLEQAMGADFSGVRVHTDAQSDQLNQSIQAKAFTTGQDVFFRQGEYQPGNRGGQELIAHELTHVVQQNGGAVKRSPLSLQKQYPTTETPSASAGVPQTIGEMTGNSQVSPGDQKTSTSILQRKMGVEFESEWKVLTPDKEPVEKDLHKKKVTGSDSFRIENDNGELEFVSDPPSEDAKTLISTVTDMANFANNMIANNKKAERLKGLPENAIIVKQNPEDYLKENKNKNLTAKDIITEIYKQEYNTEENLKKFIKTMKEVGWKDEGNNTVEKGKWLVEDYEEVFKRLKPNLVADLNDNEYQKVHSIQHILDKEPETDFKDHFIFVKDNEKEMLTRPQFTFGVPMEQITTLFQGFEKGLGNEEKQSEISYGKNEKQKLKAFSKKVFEENIKFSNNYLEIKSDDQEIMKGKTGGFITYLNFYLDKIRNAEARFNNKYTASDARSIHLAQCLLETSKASDKNSDMYHINHEELTAKLKGLLLTDQDKERINEKLTENFDEVITKSVMTTKQYNDIQKFYYEAIDDTKKDLAYPKYYFVLMNRSGFDRMFDDLSETEKQQVNEYVTEKLIPALKDKRKQEALFSTPYFYHTLKNGDITGYGLSYGPTLDAWWDSVTGTGRQTLKTTNDSTTERDLLSPPSEFVDQSTEQADPNQALGALNLIDDGKVVMELRSWGNVVPANQWVGHTTDMAKALEELLKSSDQ